MKIALIFLSLVSIMLPANVRTHEVGADRGIQQANIANLPVNDFQLRERNIGAFLSYVAFRFKVPIGLEVALKDDLDRDDDITVQIKAGTLRDVLDALIVRKPLYQWQIQENAINVFPRDEYQDPVVRKVIESRIKHFAPGRGKSRYELRQTLASTTELRSILESAGISVPNEGFNFHDVEAFDRNFAIDVSDCQVKSLLNRIISESKTKYWVVGRYGTEKQFLLIAF
jgi:hypothetical protein